MASSDRYDDIIIGAGQGGTPLSRALAQSGHRVAMVEREHTGGTCINEGCSPTKTMVANRAPEFGVHVGPVQVDMQEVR
jgi:pyruvate/2-oxoglutarate dehydrogenase complex dihydrolipoamide dehydrogenase (E3) component